jgi:hypothetical protein
MWNSAMVTTQLSPSQAAYRKEGRTAEGDREMAIYKQLKAESRARAAEATKANP